MSMTQERLKMLVSYDPESGVFTRKIVDSLRKNQSVVLNGLGASGYVVINLDKKQYRAHRLAFLYMLGEFPASCVDHINGVRHDNRFANLRPATVAENAHNTPKREENSTGFKGVTFHRRDGKFQAQIKVNGEYLYLGYFVDARMAADAYQKAARAHHGEFAKW